MPTYIVTTSNIELSSLQKGKIASQITEAHQAATGAQGFFAQVIFKSVPEGNYFLGGEPLREPQLFVHGHIRGGRGPEVKRRLIEDIVERVSTLIPLEPRFIWTYVSEIAPAQMAEYGRILPEPGHEDSWVDSLPEQTRHYIESLSA